MGWENYITDMSFSLSLLVFQFYAFASK